MNAYRETLYDAYGQVFAVDSVYFEDKTDHYHMVIFHNPTFGRVMALDGVVQTAEKDEFIYHEMLAHVPILAHGNVRSVLIVGGGDGGMLREVCRHPGIERITQVEVDQGVVELCRTHLPGHSAGCYDDPRLNLVIDDGLRFVDRTEDTFDVIISDSTDPIGPGESLFTRDFFGACSRRLAPGGVFVAQNGVAYMQPSEPRATQERMSAFYEDSTFYCAAVPTYVGGLMAFAWGSDDPGLRRLPLQILEDRFRESGLDTRYYNPAIHQAAFALPQYLLRSLA